MTSAKLIRTNITRERVVPFLLVPSEYPYPGLSLSLRKGKKKTSALPKLTHPAMLIRPDRGPVAPRLSLPQVTLQLIYYQHDFRFYAASNPGHPFFACDGFMFPKDGICFPLTNRYLMTFRT